MADSPTVVHIGENSPEQVALKLFELVAKVEKKLLYHGHADPGETIADRKYILDTYAECRRAVAGNRKDPAAAPAPAPSFGRGSI